jgi:uncharacterized protein (TIGR02757 family)
VASVAPLDARRARRLLPLLARLASEQDVADRISFDPLEFPRRYEDPADIEVVGLIAASMAYGRASVFKPRIEQVLTVMGPNPARFAKSFALSPTVEPFRGIAYRFNQPEDFAALVAAIGWSISEHGSLGRRFGALLGEHGLREGLAHFASELREAPTTTALLKRRGRRGLRYLLSDARAGGAAKRWHLYLRWMTRGPDGVDLGVWRDHVPPSALMVPLDTHIARVAYNLRLTARTDLSWKTAEEVTNSLRALDPADPVRFDFSLCHHGMSGACPTRATAPACGGCVLQRECVGRVKP